MSSDLAVRLGIQEPQILHLPPGVVSLDAAQESIEWAASCGLILDESQCISLRSGMGERADHKWAAFEVADIGPRQSTGKNDTAAARAGQEMFVAGSKLAIHTAHEAKTADESFRRMEELISNNSEMRAEVVRFRYGNGDHAIEFKSGARLLYKTRTGGSTRGFAGAALLIYDEALYLLAKHVTASLAVLARGKTAAHNPQVWSMSSAALASSGYLHDVRRRALAGNGGLMRIDGPGAGGRLAHIEHTAEVVQLVDGRIVSNRGQVDLEDRRLWAMSNPAMNHPVHGVSEEFIEAEQRFQSSDPEGWARERLGFFDPQPGLDGHVRIVSEDEWTNAGDDPAEIEPVGQRMLAWDVSPAGWSSIGWVGRRADVTWHEEIIESKAGTDWVAERLALYASGAGELVLGAAFVGGSLAEALVLDVMQAFKARELRLEGGDHGNLVKISGQAYSAACVDWISKTRAGVVRHIRQAWLNEAVDGAVLRDIGDTKVLDRKKATAEISPVVTVVAALRGLQVVPEPKPAATPGYYSASDEDEFEEV